MAIKFSQFRETIQEEVLDLSSDIQTEKKIGSRLELLGTEKKLNSLSRTYLKKKREL